MEAFSNSSLLSNTYGSCCQFWRKAAIGVSVAVASGFVGAHYYNRSCSDAGFSLSFSGSSRRRPSSRPGLDGFLPFACIAPPCAPSFTEPSTGVSFPSSIRLADDGTSTQQLAGVGLRKKSIFGLKNITIYAFGVYANEDSLRDTLCPKYGGHSVTDLKENTSFHDDIVSSDFQLTVRLIIVYGRLKVGSVRSAFEESIGSRMKKLSGTEDRPLLESFTSLFKDDIKLPKGTIIDVRRQPGHILATTINGKELGAVQSPLLCRAFCDLYIGDEPFDSKGKEDAQSKLITLISS